MTWHTKLPLVAVGAISCALITANPGLPASGSPDRSAAGLSCTRPTIAAALPLTGAVASIGQDQLHWTRFAVQLWNKAHPKMQARLLEGDTQADPAKASTVAQQFSANSGVFGIVGPGGSSEALASLPILKKVGLFYVASSATRTSLTNGDWRGYFFRVVPNDSVQGPTMANFLTQRLGVKAGDSVMIVDDQEAYSTGLAQTIGAKLKSAGVAVDRESVQQTDTDFSALTGKIGGQTKAVVLPWLIASNAQLFADQARSQGKTAAIFGSDGTFDSSKFTANGAYISFFAPDVASIPANAKLVAQFTKEYGHPGPHGAPTEVAAQVLLTGIAAACKAGHGHTTRAAVRAQVAKVHLKTSILGIPISFTRNGDVVGAKFFVFKIVNGKYVAVKS